ncbi:multidrug resistance protein [Coccidioides immitis RS]|uniref:Multidrug resistance protein n=1 Tax=Coccidioides immitis (strain RS) TaxID=246410 RepID=J3K6D5_COCIM|nr:multidrug resistance protein [Coccidioides immitis RS]EAS30121.3 multidrug resistance protein [Coccidioides immitis RS]
MEDHIVLKNGARQDAIASGAEPGIEPSQFQQQSPISKGSNTTLVDASGGSDACDSKSPTPVQVSSQEIEYLFLNFSTHLPAPSALPGSRSDKPALPEPPDLKPYTSPFEWPNTRKYVITVLACTVTVLSAAAAGCYSPPEAELTVAWGISGVVYNIGITIFTFGFAIAPMVSAPFSEINGRRPMFIASGILFVVCQIGCGVTRSFPGMILARFFLGVGGSTFSTIVGGIISDIYHTKDRNTPMALFSTAALFGTGLGPLVAGVIVKHTSWRWVYYAQAIEAAVVLVAIILFFKETRGSVLLSRKAKVLNKWYEELENAGCPGLDIPVSEDSEKKRCQRIRWKVKSDEERESLLNMLSISLYRPFHLLVTEPVVFFFSLWVSFSWAVLYLQFGSIPLVFQNNHGFDIAQSSAVFTSMSVGAIIAFFISTGQEKIAKKLGMMPTTPEGRLYFVCVGSILMPAGMFWFGWTSGPSTHWIWPALAVGCATIGIFSIYLAVFNYLADTYHRYASSALAAQSCCRNLLGGAFPLVTRAMYNNLGYPEASSLLGGIGSLLTIVPWVLAFFGPKIRARSKFASVRQVAQAHLNLSGELN